MKTASLFNVIANSFLFRVNGPKIFLCESFIQLAQAILGEEETDWSLGEFGEFTLDELIAGAYWAFSHCHGGQASEEYKVSSLLGRIFSPGPISKGPETEGEKWVYDQLVSSLV